MTQKHQKIQHLLTAFIQLLKSHGFTIDLHQALQLNTIFQKFDINDDQKVYHYSQLLAPVIAKNAAQQKEFYTIIRLFSYKQAESDKTSTSVTAESQSNNFKKWIFTSAAILLCCALLLFHYFHQATNKKPKEIRNINLPSKTKFSGNISGKSPSTTNEDGYENHYAYPSFRYQIANDITLTIQLINQSAYSKKSHIHYLVWDFGDGQTLRQTTTNNSDTIYHQFAQEGIYPVSLTIQPFAVAQRSTTRQIRIIKNISNKLPALYPLALAHPFKLSFWFWLTGAGCLLFIFISFSFLFFYLNRKVREKKEKMLEDQFKIEKGKGKTNYYYNYPDQTSHIHYETDLSKLSLQENKAPNLSHNTFDIPNTVYQTIRKGGIPALVPAKKKTNSRHIIIIQTGPFFNQRLQLIHAFFRTLFTPDTIVYYFHNTPQYLSTSPDSKATIPFYSISLYKEYTLIIIGTTTSLLEQVSRHAEKKNGF